MTYLWIGLGSALGGMMRHGVGVSVARAAGETFPWGTMVANVTGSFIIGFLAAVMGPDGRLLVSPNVRQCLLVGFCGGYTTFSSFSLQTQNLARQGDYLYAGGNVVLSVVLCLVSVWLGTAAAAAFNHLKGA
ncbi:MAG: fluoride efflux transporter CrcB [Alphaproteobacteria bacterium]|nr:fluoride efflux transporter CrcB [Alphaproteobacteria bacterium]